MMAAKRATTSSGSCSERNAPLTAVQFTNRSVVEDVWELALDLLDKGGDGGVRTGLGACICGDAHDASISVNPGRICRGDNRIFGLLLAKPFLSAGVAVRDVNRRRVFVNAKEPPQQFAEEARDEGKDSAPHQSSCPYSRRVMTL